MLRVVCVCSFVCGGRFVHSFIDFRAVLVMLIRSLAADFVIVVRVEDCIESLRALDEVDGNVVLATRFVLRVTHRVGHFRSFFRTMEKECANAVDSIRAPFLEGCECRCAWF